MYMIWQVIAENGQQRPIAVPTFLVLTGEAVTAAATATRAVATTTLRAIALAAFPLGHFYTCRTES